MGALYHISLIVWCCFEGILVTCVIGGWAQLLEILEREQYFWSYCDEESDSTQMYNETSNNVARTCSKQDSVLNLVYTFSSFATAISVFVGGKFLDTYGFTKTRILSCMIYLIAGILVYISTLGFHVLLFPGLILTCTGGSIFMACLVKVCGLIPRRRCTVVSAINASIDLSGMVFLICKFTYRAGLPFKQIVLVYYSFSVIHGLVFTFTLFPKSNKSTSKKEILTLENKNHKECSSPEDKIELDAFSPEPCRKMSLPINFHSNELIHSLQGNECSTVIGNPVGNEKSMERNDSSSSTVSVASEMSGMWCENQAKEKLENYLYFHSSDMLYPHPVVEYSTIVENKVHDKEMKRDISCSTVSSASSVSCNEIPYYQIYENGGTIMKDNDGELSSDSDGNETTETTLSPNEIYLQTNEYSTSIENTVNTVTCFQTQSFVFPQFPSITSLKNSVAEDHPIIIDNKTSENETPTMEESTMFEQWPMEKKGNTDGILKQTAVQKDESLWSTVFSLKYILHTLFLSITMLRTSNFVGMLNLSLKRLTDDPDEVDLYLTIFATILLIEVILCFIPGTLMDWNPTGKHNNYSLVLSFIVTNSMSIALSVGTLIPSLKLQMLCFVLYSLTRLFVFSCHGAFIINGYPAKHSGALFGFSLLLAAVICLIQFPLFLLVEGPCHGDPTMVNFGLLVVQILMFAHPIYLQRLSTKKEAQPSQV